MIFYPCFYSCFYLLVNAVIIRFNTNCIMMFSIHLFYWLLLGSEYWMNGVRSIQATSIM